MDILQHVKEPQQIYKEVLRLRQQAADLRDRATSTGSRRYGCKVQSTPDPDRMADLIAQAADKDAQAEQTLDRFVEVRHKLINEILLLDDPRYIEVLCNIFVWGKTAADCTKIMYKMNGDNYTYEHVLRLRRQGLAALADVLATKDPDHVTT